MTDRWRLVAAALLGLRALVALYVAYDGAAKSPDFDRFWSIASSPAAPYVAYRVEYTPFAVGLFKAIAPVARGRVAFGRAMVTIAFAADVAAAATLAEVFGWQAASLYLLATLPLLNLFYNRFDLVPTAAAVVAVAALHRQRRLASAAALLTGVAFKLWPLPLSALYLGDPRSPVRRQHVAPLVIGGVAVGLTWLALAGARGTVQVVTFRGASGWQVETLVGNLIALRSHQTLRYELNAFRVGVISSAAIVAWLTIGMEVAFALAWLGARSRQIGATWLCSIGALLMLSPLFSPQFMAWIAPGAAFAWIEGNRWPAALAIASEVLTALFWAHYDGVIMGSRWELVVTARNAVLCVMVITAIAPIVRAWRNRQRGGQETA